MHATVIPLHLAKPLLCHEHHKLSEIISPLFSEIRFSFDLSHHFYYNTDYAPVRITHICETFL